MLRVVWAVALATVLSLPAAALGADVRYASPDGSGSTCSSTLPCKLPDAVAASVNTDEVVLLAGTYTLTSTLTVDANVTLRGADGPMPTVRSSAGPSVLSLRGSHAGAPAALRHVRVEHSGDALYGVFARAYVTLVDVVVDGSEGAVIGVNLDGTGYVLRDVLVRERGPGRTEAVRMRTNPNYGGGRNTADVRNLTAYADSADGYGFTVGSVAYTSSGTCYPNGGISLTLRNAILHGGRTDLALSTVPTGSCTAPVTLDVDYANFRTADVAPPAGWGPGLVEGTHNQRTAELTDPARIFADDALHQKESSPTVDAGTSTTLMTVVDPDGDPRIAEGEVDIGADELPAAPAVKTFSADPDGTLQGTYATATPAMAWFEYGPDVAYGSRTPDQSGGPGEAVGILAKATGLAAGTTYHARVVVRGGTAAQPRLVRGPDATFTTPPAAQVTGPAPTPTPPPVIVGSGFPELISNLRVVSSVRAATLRRAGVSARFNLLQARLSYTAVLTARVGGRTVTLARATARNRPRGATLARLRVTAAGRRVLAALKRPLAANLRVTATAANRSFQYQYRRVTIRRSG